MGDEAADLDPPLPEIGTMLMEYCLALLGFVSNPASTCVLSGGRCDILDQSMDSDSWIPGQL